ncbi:MAG: peptide ABC transporter substrate-binding protein, partial [Clostridia bacterium]|nr:peptide ABC transporter substrate-binding protein [Clostridia bacterium]
MFKKIIAVLLAAAMLLSVVACAKTEAPKTDAPAADAPAADAPAADEPAADEPAADEPVEYVDPYADLAEDYDELSQAVYDDILGEFYAYYEEAQTATNTAERYAKMAIAEAKMLGAGIFLPTTSQGGNYAVTRVAPYTNTPILFGNDTYRFHDRIVTTAPIEAAHIAEMKAKWVELLGTGTYEQYVKDFLAANGYTTTDVANFYYDADPEMWDVLATSMAADSEILVNTYDGLIEYDMEQQPQPALATSWEKTNNDDGTQTWTFKLREDVVWVDNQGREVSKLTADDFVAGLQHMMDAMGGLEYLVCAGCANIVNADAYVNGEITDFAEVGVKAVDDYTVAYTLSIPTDYFITMLGYGVFAPLSREYYESMGGKFGADFDASAADYKYGKGPDSIAYNGPFRITNFTSNNQIVFESNETYWNAEGNNLKKMTFIYTDGSDPQKPYTDFFGGVVDT